MSSFYDYIGADLAVEGGQRTMILRIGDSVAWTSQAGGCTRTKVGEVIAVLRPGDMPLPGAYRPVESASPRKHVSYIVCATGPRGGKTHYWPLVKNLKPVVDRRVCLEPKPKAA